MTTATDRAALLNQLEDALAKADRDLAEVKRYLQTERWDDPGFDPVGLIDSLSPAPRKFAQLGDIV